MPKQLVPTHAITPYPKRHLALVPPSSTGCLQSITKAVCSQAKADVLDDV